MWYSKVCAKCGKNPSRKNGRYCKRCHADYMKEWRSRRIYVLKEDLRAVLTQSKGSGRRSSGTSTRDFQTRLRKPE